MVNETKSAKVNGLVTAFGGAIGLDNPSKLLRQQVADYILEHPEEYSKAILGDDPLRYTARMKQMDTWGGAIELSILSDIYSIEISSIDVKVKQPPCSFTSAGPRDGG